MLFSFAKSMASQFEGFSGRREGKWIFCSRCSSGSMQIHRTIDVYGGKIVYTAHQIAKERRMLYPTGIFRYDLATGETEELIDENTYRIRTVGHIGGEIVFSGSNLQRYGN